MEFCTKQFDAINNSVTHTFEQTKMKRFSNIDHFFISMSHTAIKAVSLKPIIDYRNFSDHICIVLSLNLAILQTSNDNIGQGINISDVVGGGEGKDRIYFDWKRANLSLFYEGTRLAFEPISLKDLVDKKKDERTQNNDQAIINNIYSNLVYLLKKISLECVPRFCKDKKAILKFW